MNYDKVQNKDIYQTDIIAGYFLAYEFTYKAYDWLIKYNAFLKIKFVIYDLFGLWTFKTKHRLVAAFQISELLTK